MCIYYENSIKIKLQNISIIPACNLIFLPNSIPYFSSICMKYFYVTQHKIMQVLLFCVLTSFSLRYVCGIHPFCCRYWFFLLYCSIHWMNKLIFFIIIYLKAYNLFLIGDNYECFYTCFGITGHLFFLGIYWEWNCQVFFKLFLLYIYVIYL